MIVEVGKIWGQERDGTSKLFEDMEMIAEVA
jgi:hypothetical protein